MYGLFQDLLHDKLNARNICRMPFYAIQEYQFPIQVQIIVMPQNAREKSIIRLNTYNTPKRQTKQEMCSISLCFLCEYFDAFQGQPFFICTSMFKFPFSL